VIASAPSRRQAVGSDRRPALLALEPHDRGVGVRHGAGRRLERAREHLVEVDRAGDLTEEPTAPALLLGPVDGAGELVPELVHPRFEDADDVGDPLVGETAGPPDERREQDEQEHDAHAESRRYGYEQVIHWTAESKTRAGVARCFAP